MSPPPAPPVDAATVILTRSTAGEAWECFMVRRHVRSEFAADVYVFPGGKVDAADRSSLMAPYVSNQTADPLLPFRIAALRELFEEAGVLLAYDSDGRIVRLDGGVQSQFARFRQQVHAGDLSMLDLATGQSLRLAVDRLHPISRWITPDTLPRRFDTYFFLAKLPEGQEPLHDTIETTAGIWISPTRALQRFRNGDFPLVFATEKHLQRLTDYDSPEEAVRATTEQDLMPVMPKIVDDGGKTLFLLPGDEGY